MLWWLAAFFAGSESARAPTSFRIGDTLLAPSTRDKVEHPIRRGGRRSRSGSGGIDKEKGGFDCRRRTAPARCRLRKPSRAALGPPRSPRPAISSAARRSGRVERSGGAGQEKTSAAYAVRHPVACKGQYRRVGVPTTAACPGAPFFGGPTLRTTTQLGGAAARRGAIIMARPNLDQLQPALVGVRSPMAFRKNLEIRYLGDMIRARSSSGSAVAVSSGLVRGARPLTRPAPSRVPA